MGTFHIRSIALKWYFFTLSSLALLGEFFHLFMKQLGLNPKQIGFTTLFGVPNLLLPLFNLIGDKFRARKAVLWIMSGCAIIDCILPLLPLLVSLPTCFGTLQSNDSSEILVKAQSTYTNGSVHLPNVTMKTVTNYQRVPWMSKLYFVMLVSRSLLTTLEGAMQSSGNVATMTYLGEERAKFGLYWMWNQVGTGVSIVITATLAWFFTINICGKEEYGYFVAFIVADVLIVSSLLSFPWLEFKYEDNRTINWSDVKGVLKRHYIFIFVLVYYIGVCTSFQLFWEFWYLDGLHANPLVMGGAAMVRRPFLALSVFTSALVIRKIGDVYTICLSLLLFSLSFLALSFTRVYWYVIALDIFQAAGFALGYSAFVVHLSKAGTKASSGVVQGKYWVANLAAVWKGGGSYGSNLNKALRNYP